MRARRFFCLEPAELFDGKKEHDSPADGDLYGTGNERGGGIGFVTRHAQHLFAALAVALENFAEGFDRPFLDTDEKRRVALAQEAAGGANYGELEACIDEVINDPIFVSVVEDANGELHECAGHYKRKSPSAFAEGDLQSNT